LAVKEHPAIVRLIGDRAALPHNRLAGSRCGLYAETELSEQEVPVAEKNAALVNYLSPRPTNRNLTAI
jgi:hypothetical protein